MPTLNCLNFLQLLEPSRSEENLCDVEFRVMDQNSRSLGSIFAHRNLLALVSPVFKKMFYGAIKEEDRVVTIQQASFAAFDLLIKFCYTGDTGLVAACKDDISQLFETCRMANMYEVPELETEVKQHIEQYQISSRNYADVFRVVEEYHGLEGFDLYCSELNQRFSKSVKAEWRNVDDVIRFFALNYNDSLEMKSYLMQKLAEELNIKQECEFCGKPSGLCKGRNLVTTSNCTGGLNIVAGTEVPPLSGGVAVPAGTPGLVLAFQPCFIEHQRLSSNRPNFYNLQIRWMGEVRTAVVYRNVPFNLLTDCCAN